MAQINIYIDFRKYTSHVQLVADLAPAFDATAKDTVRFKINLNAYSLLYSDFLLLVSTTIIYLREKGISVSGNFEDFDRNADRSRYASRVNFFELIKSTFQGNFVRHPGDGRFVEIKRFVEDRHAPECYLNFHSQVLRILYQQVNVNLPMLQMLDFSLSEIMDNALRHSEVAHGWISAQFFPTRREVRIIICDTGVGIHASLTGFQESVYRELSEPEALVKSIEKGVTRGTGMGNGLFFTSEFIKANAGQMILYSGEHYLDCTSEGVKVTKAAKWNGTFAFFKINTDIPVDHTEILGTDSTRADDFEWLMEQNFGVDNTLW